MRILLHSHAPWVKSGYGQQCEQVALQFRAMGHDVAISAFRGLSGVTVDWNRVPVYSANGSDPFGMDMIEYFYGKWNADVVIILTDAWKGTRYSGALSKLNVANWIPIDSYPLSRLDYTYLIASGAAPIAMSRFGERMLAEAGIPALYAPHAVDTETFAPYDDQTDRDALREELIGSLDTFVIGINAANRDILRKGFFEQFAGFAEFHKRYPNSQLYVHTAVSHPSGMDILSLVRACGIEDSVIFPDQGVLAAGEIDTPMLVRNFYHMLDLYSGCSLAEGFGLPLIEAQACGVPVVVTDASAMTELCGLGGVLVQGEPLWVEGHQSRWTKPSIAGIAAAYEQMYHVWLGHEDNGSRVDARAFALQYDVRHVASLYWEPTLKALEGGS